MTILNPPSKIKCHDRYIYTQNSIKIFFTHTLNSFVLTHGFIYVTPMYNFNLNFNKLGSKGELF